MLIGVEDAARALDIRFCVGRDAKNSYVKGACLNVARGIG